jgi:hypothetical protein
MQGHHSIANFFGPGIAMCDRCERVVDVYEWSEPCEGFAPLEGENGTAVPREPELVLS